MVKLTLKMLFLQNDSAENSFMLFHRFHLLWSHKKAHRESEFDEDFIFAPQIGQTVPQNAVPAESFRRIHVYDISSFPSTLES